MIILKKGDKEALNKFLLSRYEEDSKELIYVKKHINNKTTLDIFQYKSYYLLTYAYFENFYKLFSLELIKVAKKQHFNDFSNFIDAKIMSKSVNFKKASKKVYITSNNAYIKVYEKNNFLYTHIRKDMLDISFLIKRTFYCKNIENYITIEITNKLNDLKEVRDDLIHESNSKKYGDIDDYKELLEELLLFIDNIFDAITSWVNSEN